MSAENALEQAWDVQQAASNVGFDWDSINGALEKVVEEIDEVRKAHADRDREAAREELGLGIRLDLPGCVEVAFDLDFQVAECGAEGIHRLGEDVVDAMLVDDDASQDLFGKAFNPDRQPSARNADQEVEDVTVAQPLPINIGMLCFDVILVKLQRMCLLSFRLTSIG